MITLDKINNTTSLSAIETNKNLQNMDETSHPSFPWEASLSENFKRAPDKTTPLCKKLLKLLSKSHQK